MIQAITRRTAGPEPPAVLASGAGGGTSKGVSIRGVGGAVGFGFGTTRLGVGSTGNSAGITDDGGGSTGFG